MLFKKDFLKLPKNEENQINEDINKNIIEQEENDSISEVFENKSSILTMLFLFALMIIFVLFIFFKMNN